MKAVLVIDLPNSIDLSKLSCADISIDRYDTCKVIKRKAVVEPISEMIPVDWINKNADIFFYGIERLRLMDMINKWKQENNVD